jgi:drug/metabolite transporter (DMT)-like permease
MNPQRAGDLYALSCALVCGLGNIMAKTALEGMSVELFNLYFYFLGFIISSFSLLKRNSRAEIINISFKVLALIFFLAILFTTAMYLFLTSLKLIEPATVSFLSRFEVIMTVVLAYIILKERLLFIEIIGGLIALAGVFILKFKTNMVVSYAATLMIISSFFFAVAEIIIKKNIAKLGTARFLFYRNMFVTFIMFIILPISGHRLYIPDINTLLLILGAAILLPVLGRGTYMEALQRINISRAVLITQSTPLFTALFAFVILYTYPPAIEWLGGGLIIAGVVLVKISEKRINRTIK